MTSAKKTTSTSDPLEAMTLSISSMLKYLTRICSAKTFSSDPKYVSLGKQATILCEMFSAGLSRNDYEMIAKRVKITALKYNLTELVEKKDLQAILLLDPFTMLKQENPALCKALGISNDNLSAVRDLLSHPALTSDHLKPLWNYATTIVRSAIDVRG